MINILFFRELCLYLQITIIALLKNEQKTFPYFVVGNRMFD